MNGVMKKLAALILAVAMITTFTPLYGAGAIAYAEDEEVAVQQDNAAAENEDPDGTAAGDENLAPAEGTEVTGTEGAEEDVSSEDDGEGVVQEDPTVEDSGDDEEEIKEESKEEIPEVETEEKLPAMEGAEGNLRGDDDDPFAGVYQTGLEGPNIIFNDGLAKYKLNDQEALNVEGVTHYEAFVGVPREGPWAAVDPACYSYDDSTKTVTVDGRVLEQKHPDYMMEKRLAVQILGLDAEDNFKMIASKMDVDFWPTYSRYDLPEDREILPGWDGSIDGRVHYYVENCEYPDGYDTNLNVEDVEVIEGRDLLEDWHYDEDDNNHWWYYRAGRQLGNVTFRMTYRDVDGSTKTHDVHVSIGGDVYEVNLFAEGNIDRLLPGQNLTFHAWAGHKYWNGKYEEYTEEGLDLEWSLIRNDAEAGEITVDSKDQGTAVLHIREPEDEEDFRAGIRVKVAVIDKKEPGVEKNSQDRWVEVGEDFFDIRPGDLNFNLPVGQSITQEFTIHHFIYDNGMIHDDIVPITRTQIDYNEEALKITREGSAEPVVSEEDFEGTDTFTIKRIMPFGNDINLKLWCDDGSGEREIECHKNYWFSDMDYWLGLDCVDDNVYLDNDCIVELQTNENVDYSALDIRIKTKYRLRGQEDFLDDVPEDCITMNDDGMSWTLSGAAMAEHGIEELKIRPEAWYDEKMIRDGDERTFWLRDSCPEWGEEHLWLTSPPEYKDCVSKGTQKMMCWNCHQKKIVTVPPRGHVAKAVNAKAATAKAEGNIKYWKCSFCGKCFIDAKCTKEIKVDGTKIPKGMTLSKVTPQKKALTAKWKAPTGTDLAHISGYEIMVALNSKFTSGKKTVTVTSPKTASKKVTGLKAGKKYYVKIRKYRTIAGKKYYSPWSKAKTATTKK